MNELALFAGAGGGILGAKLLGWRTVCAVEIDAYCRRVLMQRQNDGVLDPFPIWDDVRTFDGLPWYGKVDVISAGFPCQPFSVAGKQQGANDERNMWPETLRIIREVRPSFAFLENVPALISSGYFGIILRGLAESGYDARWDVFSAAGVGAPHLRKRVWIVADAESLSVRRDISKTKQLSSVVESGKGMEQGRDAVADSAIAGLEGAISTGKLCKGRKGLPTECSAEWWSVEPDVGRVAHEIPARVDRLKGLGNAQVPQVVVRAWRALSG